MEDKHNETNWGKVILIVVIGIVVLWYLSAFDYEAYASLGSLVTGAGSIALSVYLGNKIFGSGSVASLSRWEKWIVVAGFIVLAAMIVGFFAESMAINAAIGKLVAWIVFPAIGYYVYRQFGD